MSVRFLKSMPLATYIFSLLGIFLLVISLGQFALIQVVESRINNEIADRSVTLSKRAIDFVVNTQSPNVFVTSHAQENLDTLTVELSQMVKSTISGASSQDAPTARSIVSVQRHNHKDEQDVAVDIQQEVAVETLKNIDDMRSRLEDLSIERAKGNFFVFKTSDDSLNTQDIFIEESDTTVSRYFTYLSGITLMMGAASLLFAYVLARHVSQPLLRLNKGFVQLGKGNFAYRLSTDGAKEVKDTLEQFNQMSERLEQLQTLEQTYLKQQQLAELGEISRGLAHSLRNPLNTIGLALEEAAQTGLSDQDRINIAEQARSKISALDRTIKSLLVLTTSGIDRDQPVALLDIIQDAILQIGTNTKVVFTMEKPDEDLSILGAATEITAMVSTLISNAAEASENGQNVVIKWYQQGGMIFIEVIDEGRGLDADIEQRLFTPHVTTKPEGAGMGLYIAKRIANLHYDGDISLRNNTSATGCSARLSLGNASSHNAEDRGHDA